MYTWSKYGKERCSWKIDEERYGCLIGTDARDKDAIAAVMALCEVACYARSLNKTLCDMMIDIYNKYGYYKEDLVSFTLKGIDGSEKIKGIMEYLRNNPLNMIGNEKVIAIRDYTTDERLELSNNKKEKMNMPKSDVLYYELENNGWFCVRPSGTEPKIKIYMGIKGTSLDLANNKLNELKQELIKLLEEKM